MAIAFVVATKIESGSGTVVSGNITLPSVGNCLVVAGAQFQGTGSNATCSDNMTSPTNTYVAIGNQRSGANPTPLGNAWLTGFICGNILKATGTFTVSVDGKASSVGGTYICVEVSGQNTTTPNPDAATTKHDNTGATETTTSLTNSNANSICISWAADDQSSNPATLTSPGGIWNLAGNELNAVSFQDVSVIYTVVSSSAGRTPAWTVASGFNWGTIQTDVQQAAAAAAQVPYMRYGLQPFLAT